MQIAHIQIPYRSRKDTFRIWFIGDVHLGSKLCDEKQLRADLDAIRVDPNARIILMGDLCEYIAANDWRFERDNIADWVDPDDVGRSQMRYAAKLFDVVAGQNKILGGIQGNHERTIECEFNQAVHKSFCDDLEITNLGYSAFMRVTFRCKTGDTRNGNTGQWRPLDIYLHHGYGGSRQPSSDVSKFNDVFLGYDCDLAVMAHTHQRVAYKSVQMRMNPLADDFIPRTRLACRSGTYLKTAQKDTISYSERAGMKPLTTGGLCVTYHPDRREMVANV